MRIGVGERWNACANCCGACRYDLRGPERGCDRESCVDDFRDDDLLHRGWKHADEKLAALFGAVFGGFEFDGKGVCDRAGGLGQQRYFAEFFYEYCAGDFGLER